MKQIRFLLAVLMAFVFTARAWAQTEEAYAVLSTDGETLTFYYDGMKAAREGTAYPIPWEGSFPGWDPDDNPTITTVDFDDSFDNYHGLTTARYMFYGQKVLTTINHIERLHTEHVTTMYGMFAYCYKLRELDLSSFDTSNVTDMGIMFKECKELASLDVSNFNTASVTNMFYMFNACKTLKSLNLTSFNTLEVENMEHMFDYCISLTTIYCNDDWSKGKVKHSDCMFDRCSQLKGAISYDPYSGKEDVTYANPTTGYFTGSEAYAVVDENAHTLVFYYDINKSTREGEVIPIGDNDWYWHEIYTVTVDPSMANCHSLTSTKGMFSHMEFVDEIIGLEYLNTENVTDMSGMFNGSYQLQSLDLSNFNTSKVTDMSAMFSGCEVLESLDLSNFNTSKVTDMSYMFYDCRALTSLDLLNFNTGKVTDMKSMFYQCAKLATIYCYDNWQKDGLEDTQMFYNCRNLVGAVSFNESSINAGMANPDTGYFSRYESIAIDETSFPDDNFRTWVLQQSYGQDGILTLEEANQVTRIDVMSKKIADLKGIEFFSELADLNCRNNPLGSLDMSHNTKLQELDCCDTRLQSLNMTGCAPTGLFNCSINMLRGEAMDEFISSLPTVSMEQIPNILIYNESSRYEQNVLTTKQINAILAKGWGLAFYIDENTGVYVRHTGDVPITKYNFPDNNFRAWLIAQDFGSDYILSAEEIEETTSIDVWGEDIADLTGLEFFSALKELDCNYNPDLTTLDVSPFRDLESLKCYSCALTSLDVSMARSLKTLQCQYNQLTSLTVGDMNGSLEKIDCGHNQLTSLDVSECPELTDLSCEYNQIEGEAMDELVGSLQKVSNGFFYVFDKDNPTIEQNVITMQQAAVADRKGWQVYKFNIPINETTFPGDAFREMLLNESYGEDEKLTPSEIVNVTFLGGSGNNNITDLTGIEYFTELTTLNFHDCCISKLDVSQNTKLSAIQCSTNFLTSLDVSNNPELRALSICDNNIHGAAMSALVESLPTVESGELIVWGGSDDGNVITVDQVALARAKGWEVLDRYGDDYDGVSVEKGDANGDGELTIDDAVAVANSIIGQTPDIFNSTAADVNNDGEVTIADVTAIINNVIFADAKANLMARINVSEEMLNACMTILSEHDSADAYLELLTLATAIAKDIADVKHKAANATTLDDIDDCFDDVMSIDNNLAELKMRINQLEHGY